MFDNLRDEADYSGSFDATPFYEDEDQFRAAEEAKPAPPRKKAKKVSYSSGGRFLGMTAPQRFALALMLFITVCLMGAMLLLVTGRIGLL